MLGASFVKGSSVREQAGESVRWQKEAYIVGAPSVVLPFGE